MSGATQIIKVSPKKIEVLTDITAAEANRIRKRILDLKISIERDYLEMGGHLDTVLSRGVNKQPVWKTWGFNNFHEYVENELGFRQRKAFFYIDVYRQTADGPLPKKAVEQLGMAKAAKLAELARKGVIDKDNVDKWVADAGKKSYEELTASAKVAEEKAEKRAAEKKATDKPEAKKEPILAEEIHIYRYGLYKEQAEIWELALAKARTITGSDKDPWLVECIAQHFLSEACEKTAESTRVLCSRLERTHSVKIAAFDEKTGECVYGENLVQMAQEADKK